MPHVEVNTRFITIVFDVEEGVSVALFFAIVKHILLSVFPIIGAAMMKNKLLNKLLPKRVRNGIISLRQKRRDTEIEE